MTADISPFAPGSRLLIRDEEWLVKNALPVSTGGFAVRVVGLSELVRNHEAVFLTKLDRIEQLKPEDTQLVPDDSPQYRRSRLYLESLLRRAPPTDARIYLGDQAAINSAAYQLVPAAMALEALRPRILIADGVGLGKTVEVGILLSELIKRGRGERILVVAIRSMLTQFQQEIWSRFSIPLVRLDSVGLQRVRARIPSNKNPFYYYDRVIISVDTLKNDAQYRHYLEQCHWDVIVIDECQNVANIGSQRSRLASLLARTCDSLILTSATPHNGRPESFANLMNMLEPTAIADPTDYTAEDIKGLFVRRFKKDLGTQVAAHFSDRQVVPLKGPASLFEEAFFQKLAAVRFHALDRRSTGHDALFRIGVLKAFLSSPDASVESLDYRLERVQERLTNAARQDRAPAANRDPHPQATFWQQADRRQQYLTALTEDQQALRELRSLAGAIAPATFSKYQRLLQLLRQLGVDASLGSPRVIIFSERIATLRFLVTHLRADLHAGEESIVLFHAGLPDTEQQQIVEDFGKEDSPIRILVASDVASEGINLHYHCHLMIHFDIPWSLITLEQRNGRIDRYGQEQPPIIHYLLTVSVEPAIRGDLRIIDKLIEKEQEAYKNIGDAATILGLYEASKEEDHIERGVAQGKDPEEILEPPPAEDDWLTLLLSAAGAAVGAPEERDRPHAPSLYADDLAFARAAFDELRQSNPQASDAIPAPEFHPQRPEFTLLASEDLRQRCEFLPQEAVPADRAFHLTTDRQRVMQAIAAARMRKGEWPREQLFWELHPAMEWLLDKLLVCFGRHEAPVIIAPRLRPQALIFLFQGVLSNKRSQPVIAEWFGLHLIHGQQPARFLTLDEVLEQTGFASGLANPGRISALQSAIPAFLPALVEQARQRMAQRRLDRGQVLRKSLQDDLRKLDRWRDAAFQRIDDQMQNAHGAHLARLKNERTEIEALYRQRDEWLRETLMADPNPYLRLALIFAGE